MKISRRLMWAPWCLLLLLQGCGSSPATGLDVAAMSLTPDETYRSATTFKPADTPIYANAVLNGTGNGATIKFVWIAVNAGGDKNKALVEKEFVAAGAVNKVNGNLAVARPGGLSKGAYKTEIYFNDKLDKSLEWKVE